MSTARTIARWLSLWLENDNDLNAEPLLCPGLILLGGSTLPVDPFKSWNHVQADEECWQTAR